MDKKFASAEEMLKQVENNSQSSQVENFVTAIMSEMSGLTDKSELLCHKFSSMQQFGCYLENCGQLFLASQTDDKTGNENCQLSDLGIEVNKALGKYGFCIENPSCAKGNSEGVYNYIFNVKANLTGSGKDKEDSKNDSAIEKLNKSFDKLIDNDKSMSDEYKKAFKSKPIKIGIAFLIILFAFFILNDIRKSGNADTDTKTATTSSKSNSTISSLEDCSTFYYESPNGELAEMFTMNSKFTDLQRKNKKKEMIGQIVKWALPVYEVHQVKQSNKYKVTTSSSGKDGKRYVSCDIEVTARDDNDRKILENLQTGFLIPIVGKITDVTAFRDIEISPAIIDVERPKMSGAKNVEIKKFIAEGASCHYYEGGFGWEVTFRGNSEIIVLFDPIDFCEKQDLNNFKKSEISYYNDQATGADVLKSFKVIQ